MAYEYLPQQVRELIGKETERKPAAVAVERALIDHWIEVTEDANPIYCDEVEAKRRGHASVVAPPGMLMSWAIPFTWTPRQGQVDPTKEGAGSLFFRVQRMLKFSKAFGSRTELEWLKPVLLGDRLTYRERLTDVSPEKQTRAGAGNFLTIETIYANQGAEDVGVMRMDYFVFDREAK